MDIQGKRVVVTGAASGIGKALVLAFHKHGASKVVSVDINKADADTTAKEVCLLYTSPSPRDKRQSRMPSSA